MNLLNAWLDCGLLLVGSSTCRNSILLSFSPCRWLYPLVSLMLRDSCLHTMLQIPFSLGSWEKKTFWSDGIVVHAHTSSFRVSLGVGIAVCTNSWMITNAFKLPLQLGFTMAVQSHSISFRFSLGSRDSCTYTVLEFSCLSGSRRHSNYSVP